MAEVVEDLKLLVRTRHAIVTIRTLDESFATRAVQLAGREMGMPVLAWSASESLRSIEPPTKGGRGGTESFKGALKFIRSNEAFNI